MANAIQKRIAGLPVKAKDLAKYILIGEKALIAQKAKYAAIQTAGESTTAIQAALSDTQDMAEGLLYAEARLGEIMEETPKQGKKGYGHPGGTIPTLPPGYNKQRAYQSRQISRHQETIAQVVARAREEGEVPVRKHVLREIRLTQVKPAPKPLPKGKYKVIYADPPWKYADKLVEGYGTVEHHYPAMTIDELCAMKVKDIALTNAVLFLWVTSPMLADCWPVVKAWGFQYKASIIWHKLAHNYGHYCSVRHEFLLICTRGSCLPEIKKLFPSVVEIERSKHSEKPEEFRAMIDKMYPTGARIELFARVQTKGWNVYGNEVS